jgi:hypothetical protein
MPDRNLLLDILKAHTQKWVQYFRFHRDEYVHELQQEFRKSIRGERKKLSQINIYYSDSEGPIRLQWFKYSGNPRSRGTKKQFYRFRAKYYVHRGAFRDGPDWQEEVCNRCEDEFERVRRLQDIQKQLHKLADQFNYIASGEEALKKNGKVIDNMNIHVDINVRPTNEAN